jgi:hypothetical protein
LGISQSIFTKNYPSNENYRAFRVKQDFDGNFVLSGYKDVVAENAMRPYVFKVSNTGQKLDSAIYFSGMPYDWNIMDVLIDSNYYYFIGYSGDWSNVGFGPNDSSMFLLKTDYNFNPIDTHFYQVVDNQDIGHSTSKFDSKGNIITAGYYSTLNGHFGSFINKINKEGNLINSSYIPFDSNRIFLNLMIDSNAYYVFSYIFSGIKPRLIYKYDTLLNLIDTYIIPANAMNFYSPIKFGNNEYFTSGYTYPDPIVIHLYQKFAIIKSTIEGVLLDSLQFGVVDSTNYPAFYDALCMQNGYLYFAGSVHSNKTIPPYGENHPSNLYIAKVDTGLNIVWEKLIGGDAYYTAMNVIGTSDGGILMMASRNDITDNKNNLDIRLVKLDSNGNITWTKDVELHQTEIIIYPNPAKNILNIEFSESINNSNCKIDIYNNLGQIILNGSTNTNKTKIDIQSLKTGVYVLKIESEKGWTKSKKFIKK